MEKYTNDFQSRELMVDNIIDVVENKSAIKTKIHDILDIIYDSGYLKGEKDALSDAVNAIKRLKVSQ